jgi:hypothetical protein
MFSPDAGGAPAAVDTIEAAFGDLRSSARPDLFLSEQVEKKRVEKEGRVPNAPIQTVEVETERPEVSKTEAPATEEAEKEALPKAPAKTEAPEAEDEETELPEEPEDALSGIMAKYKTPEGLAAGLKGMQTLQFKTAEEKKAALERVRMYEELVSRDYELDPASGKYILRSDAAAKVLQSRRGLTKPAPQEISEQAIRKEITAEFRASIAEQVDEQYVDSVLQGQKALIDKSVKDRVERLQIEAQADKVNTLSAVGEIVSRHMARVPADEKNLAEINAVYSHFPQDVAVSAVIDGWLPFDKVARWVRLEKGFESALKEAWENGKKARTGEPGETITPSGRGQSPRRKGAAADPNIEFKNQILGAGILPSIESAFGRTSR